MIKDMLLNYISKTLPKRLRDEERVLEYMLRNQVEPPVRGEVTKWKILWRGLRVARDTQYNLIGIFQRGKFIKPDYEKMNMQFINEDRNLFGQHGKED